MADCSSWQTVKDRFLPDGSLRDVYVLNTARDDWEKFISFLKTVPVSPVMTRGDEAVQVELPEDFPAFANDRPRPLLHFTVGGLLCACHFFSDDVIEFDINPFEMRTEEQFESFLSFLKQLRDSLDKDVIVTEENCLDYPDAVIMRLPVNKGLN